MGKVQRRYENRRSPCNRHIDVSCVNYAD